MRAPQVRYGLIVAQPAHADMPEDREGQVIGGIELAQPLGGGIGGGEVLPPCVDDAADDAAPAMRQGEHGECPAAVRVDRKGLVRQPDRLRQHAGIGGGLPATEQRACP
jgi:hypothetical protein